MLETSNVLGSGSPSEMLIGRMAKLLPSILIGNPCKSRLTQTLNQLSLSSPVISIMCAGQPSTVSVPAMR